MKIREKIKNICLEDKDQESCGIISMDDTGIFYIKQLNNVHVEKNKYFKISLSEWIKEKNKNKILAVFHSHTSTTEDPSSFDIEYSEELCIPFIVYSIYSDKFFLHFPESYEPEKLTGRFYIEDIHECTCLIKDYFDKKLDLKISKWIKNYCIPKDAIEANKLFKKVFQKNMQEVNKINEIKKHDVLIFKFSDNKKMHGGIYLGDEIFLHQKTNQISSRTFLDQRWKSKLYKIYRHKALV
jgi:proteasome lid subunit RPN8/RPN11